MPYDRASVTTRVAVVMCWRARVAGHGGGDVIVAILAEEVGMLRWTESRGLWRESRRRRLQRGISQQREVSSESD